MALRQLLVPAQVRPDEQRLAPPVGAGLTAMLEGLVLGMVVVPQRPLGADRRDPVEIVVGGR